MIHLTHQNPHNGQSHFYHLEIIPGLFGQWGVQREWGRKGQRGTLRVNWYDSQEEAHYALSQLAEAKLETWWRKLNPSRAKQSRRGRPAKTSSSSVVALE
jgi:predicted DNA-binding WGR domain protein